MDVTVETPGWMSPMTMDGCKVGWKNPIYSIYNEIIQVTNVLGHPNPRTSFGLIFRGYVSFSRFRECKS